MPPTVLTAEVTPRFYTGKGAGRIFQDPCLPRLGLSCSIVYERGATADERHKCHSVPPELVVSVYSLANLRLS